MFVTLIRTLILYIVAITSVRIMGKRQLGELQPSELVITLMLSEIIATPIEDAEAPLISTFIAVSLLVAFEIITSLLNMKSIKFRTLLHGHSLIIINDGVIDQRLIKKLRFTVDDLLEALRQKDIFDISQVQYAIAETNGQISVMKKADYEPLTPRDLDIKKEPEPLQCPVIIDGKKVRQDYHLCNMDDEKIDKILKKEGLNISRILLMTINKKRTKNIIMRDNCE